MAIGFGEHDAQAFAISIFGIPLDGFAKDSVIEIEPNEDNRKNVTGADGHIESAKMADESATVKVHLMRTSVSHKALRAVYKADRNTRGGATVGPFIMRDTINGMEETSERAWIARRPDYAIGSEVGEVVWTFTLAKWVSNDPA